MGGGYEFCNPRSLGVTVVIVIPGEGRRVPFHDADDKIAVVGRIEVCLRVP